MDATLEFLESLKDESRWHIRRNVPVFGPHSRKDAEGKERYKVTDKTLERICNNAREREKKKGVVGLLSIGHRPLDRNLPESEVPRFAKPVGYILNYRNTGFGPEGEPCAMVDEYIKKEHWEEAKHFPFRSAEYWPSREEITGVALLLRDPELDLGMVASGRENYERVAGPIYYSMPSDDISPEKAKKILKDDSAQGHPLTEKQKGMFGAAAGKANNERSDMADPTLPPGGPAAGPQGVDPNFHEMFKRCMDHHMAQYGPGGPAVPGPTAALPGAAPPVAPKPPPPVAPPAGEPPMKKKEDEDMEAMSRTGGADFYARLDQIVSKRVAEQTAVADARFKELERQNYEARQETKRAQIRGVADTLENHGWMFNKGRFIERCLPLDEKGIQAEVEDVTQYGRQNPARSFGGDHDALTLTAENGTLSFSKKKGEMTVSQLDRELELARNYEREGMPWDKAVEKAKAQSA